MKRERQEPQAPSDAKVNRFEIGGQCDGDSGHCYAEMEGDPDGEWVRYLDYSLDVATARAAGYAAGVKDERAKLIALRERALANLNDIEAQLAADRARSDAPDGSDAQEVKP